MEHHLLVGAITLILCGLSLGIISFLTGAFSGFTTLVQHTGALAILLFLAGIVTFFLYAVRPVPAAFQRSY